jgi:signal-transduction protein with cAMP-binding, CBS, and nucleotidyltransferase domain
MASVRKVPCVRSTSVTLRRLSLNRRRPSKHMEQIKANRLSRAHFIARTVRDIIKPAKSISNQVSVKAALDELQARAIDSSPVIDQRGELLGTLSKNKMNRNVGGFGHDPNTEPVEAHIEKNHTYCFEDQTIAEAEQMMLNAKIGEVSVVTREKLLVGTINIEAIAQKERSRKRLEPPKSRA